jgi:hypothetical protein
MSFYKVWLGSRIAPYSLQEAGPRQPLPTTV